MWLMSWTWLLFYIIPGVIAGAIASHKGRNVAGWFFGGFFFHIVGIVIVTALPNLNEQKAQREHMEKENRRLKERLKQEQVKSEAFRRHAISRLDAHDTHLGLDTKQTYPLLGVSEDSDPLRIEDADDGELSTVEDNDGARTRKWHYQWNGEEHGPIAEKDLLDKFSTGQLNGATLVWNEDLSTWTRAEDIPLLKGKLAA